MKYFKLTVFGFLIGLGLTTSSCKKYVTEHEQNYPHTDINVQEVTISNWVGDASGYEGTIVGESLTPALLSQGIVMCYIKDGDSYIAMPITLSYGTYISHWAFSQNSNSITILNYDDDGATPEPGTQTFKIAIFTQAGLINHPNVDITDYESVKKEYNL
jgi:hypothetical protein